MKQNYYIYYIYYIYYNNRLKLIARSCRWRAYRIGTILIRAAEQRISARGMRRAGLTVEENNPRAHALYERLGYVAYGREPAAWDEDAPDGSIVRHETACTLMRKEFP